MDNDHSYEYLTIIVFDVGVPDQLVLLEAQLNPAGIKMGRKIGALPLLIPAPYLRNKAVHHQAIQLIDRFAIRLFCFSEGVTHGDELSA